MSTPPDVVVEKTRARCRVMIVYYRGLLCARDTDDSNQEYALGRIAAYQDILHIVEDTPTSDTRTG